MSANTIDFKANGTVNTDRTPSPAIWADCPWLDLVEGCVDGVYCHDDFVEFPLVGTQTTEIWHGKYKVFNTGAAKVIPVSAINSVEKAGAFLSLPVDTDNDSASIAHSYPSFLLSGLPATSGKLWFEARIAFTPIVTNGIGWFVGLAEVEQWTLATGVPFNAGDPITNSASAIGFRKPEDNTTTYDTVYSDRATSFTAIGSGEGTGAVAYTFVKLGMLYDPANLTRCIRFFIDNVELTTAMTRAALLALTNLDANSLGLIAAVVADSAGTSGVLYMDWWRCAQLLP